MNSEEVTLELLEEEKRPDHIGRYRLLQAQYDLQQEMGKSFDADLVCNMDELWDQLTAEEQDILCLEWVTEDRILDLTYGRE